MGDVTGLEADLRANGIDVERLDTDGGVDLRYVTAFPGDRVNHGEMGRALTVLIELARDGEWDPVPVEATVLRHPGDVQGTWRAEPEWFEALLAGELSETAFSGRVLGTLE